MASAERGQQEEKVAVTPLVKYSVFVGIFLTRLLDCIPWVWGNLSVYVISYYYDRGDSFAGGLTNWLVMVNVTGFDLGMLIAGTLNRKIGEITTMFIFIVFYNAGLFLTYATLKYSAVVMCIAFGGMTGLGSGVIQSTQLTLIVRWTNKYYGLATSSVPSSNIAFSILLNLAATWYINPTNFEPDSTEDRMAIFTQKELIDKVPPALLYFAIFSFIINMVGFFLLRSKPGCKNIFTEMILALRRKNCCGVRMGEGEREYIVKAEVVTSSQSDYLSSQSQQIEYNGETCEIMNEHGENNSTTATTKRGIENDDDDGGNGDYNHPASTQHSKSNSNDVTPREALKRKEFYALWIFVGIQTYAFFLKSTYYKTFGLLYIPDDHFLTFIGIINCGVTPLCAWFSGYGMDKFGVKPTIMVISSLFAVVASVFYLTVVNKWLYLLACMVYGGSLFTLYCLTAACCLKLFGQTYFTSILGMTLTSAFVLTFTLPPLAGWVIATYGWFVLFISAAFLAFVGLLILVWGLPENCG